MPTEAELLQGFKAAFTFKYAISDKPLGSGSFGAVYRAKDIDRNIDVAVKLFNDGQTPAGVERGWHLTSRLIHAQVVPTYTVETFLGLDGLQYKAVVSRFVPGKSLREVFEWWNAQTQLSKKSISEDFSKTFLPSVIDALSFCHNKGFGHGDLHEGNIMVLPTNFAKQNTFEAILIDFDNASFKSNLAGDSEKEKMEKDVRLLARIASYLMIEWKWGTYVEPVFNAYTSIDHIKRIYQAILIYISGIEDQTHDLNRDLRFALSLMRAKELTTLTAKPAINVLRKITASIGKSSEFEVQLARIMNELERLNDDLKMEEVTIDRINIYGSLFH